MREKNFQAGFHDARAGRPFAIDEHQKSGDRWGYERGRQFAALYPAVRRLDEEAVKLLDKALTSGDILPR
jgi:hypothetical protein